MADDYTNDTTVLLTQFMDGELSDTEKETVADLLKEDTKLNERYHQLVAAKQAIKLYGLKQRVQFIQNEYLNEANNKTVEPVKVKSLSLFKVVMRVAAVFFIAIAGYGVFQYTSTSTQSVYNDNFTSYKLPVNRGNENVDNIDALYNAGEYDKAIVAINTKENKNQKDYFLEGQSYLQLDNANAAIPAFKQVENMNQQTREKYFVEETDYYLLLAYIKAGEIKEAQQRLEKIESNKQHLFYNNAENISKTKLFILKLKEK